MHPKDAPSSCPHLPNILPSSNICTFWAILHFLTWYSKKQKLGMFDLDIFLFGTASWATNRPNGPKKPKAEHHSHSKILVYRNLLDDALRCLNHLKTTWASNLLNQWQINQLEKFGGAVNPKIISCLFTKATTYLGLRASTLGRSLSLRSPAWRPSSLGGLGTTESGTCGKKELCTLTASETFSIWQVARTLWNVLKIASKFLVCEMASPMRRLFLWLRQNDGEQLLERSLSLELKEVVLYHLCLSHKLPFANTNYFLADCDRRFAVTRISATNSLREIAFDSHPMITSASLFCDESWKEVSAKKQEHFAVQTQANRWQFSSISASFIHSPHPNIRPERKLGQLYCPLACEKPGAPVPPAKWANLQISCEPAVCRLFGQEHCTQETKLSFVYVAHRPRSMSGVPSCSVSPM